MNYTRNEIVAIFEYNYERCGIVESIFRSMNHLRSISFMSGADKKTMIIETIMSCVEFELEKFLEETIEFIYENLIVKHKKKFFTCIR